MDKFIVRVKKSERVCAPSSPGKRKRGDEEEGEEKVAEKVLEKVEDEVVEKVPMMEKEKDRVIIITTHW